MELYNSAVKKKCGLLTPKQRAITGYRTMSQMKRDMKHVNLQDYIQHVYHTKYLLELPYEIHPTPTRTPTPPRTPETGTPESETQTEAPTTVSREMESPQIETMTRGDTGLRQRRSVRGGPTSEQTAASALLQLLNPFAPNISNREYMQGVSELNYDDMLRRNGDS